MQLAENLVVAGRFRLNRLIGRGGMGSVWQATHLGLDIPCAVKFIEGEYANLAEAQQRFEREAKAAAQLRSPHVVQILDHGVWENTPYIAMELLDGEDLGKRLRSAGALRPDEINTIVQQVCRALSKAHAAGIVHRDLKPDNIFLVRDDDREIVKVLDFGIAKKSAAGSLESGSNTKTGAMLGTPYYMSPEQAQGIKSVDARSDLWSLAVIVFQMLTGKLPFESEALGDLLVKIIVSPVPTPSQVGRVPPQFDRWWAKAADRDVLRRFQTAKEFADSLALVLGQSSVTDVMDRGQLNAALGSGTALLQHGNPQHLAVTPNPMQQTPQPVGMLMNTPHPGFGGHPSGGMAITPALQQSTGAPLSRTNGTEHVSGPKKGGAIVIAAIAGIVALGVVGGGIAFGVSKSKKAAAAGDAPTAMVTATATVAPPPDMATAAATTTAAPPPTDSAATTPAPPASAATATAAAQPVAKPSQHGSTQQPKATTSGATKPPATTKPAKPDMGF